MLAEFLRSNREEVIKRARALAVKRKAPAADQHEIDKGIPLFFDQLLQTLIARTSGQAKAIDFDARAHGAEMLRQGFTVAQLVHDYGDVCQAITALAIDVGEPIGAEDYKTLNGCLDDATASAVTEFLSGRETSSSRGELERLGRLAHEQRNLLNAAMLAFQVLRSGSVGISGNTGALLGRSLMGLRDLIDRALAEVRLGNGVTRVDSVELAGFIEEIEVAASLESRERGLQLTVMPAEYGVSVQADRQLLAAALGNVLSNAFKFTRPGTRVTLRTALKDGGVRIEVEDECGGLPAGVAEELFKPYEQRGTDRSGLGLGLAIARQGLAAFGASLSIHDLPGKGCIFAIDLVRN